MGKDETSGRVVLPGKAHRHIIVKPIASLVRTESKNKNKIITCRNSTISPISDTLTKATLLCVTKKKKKMSN